MTAYPLGAFFDHFTILIKESSNYVGISIPSQDDALGREKMDYILPVFETALTRGFDAVRPAALIFRHSPYGAAGSLAVAQNCQGPFYTIEGDELAANLTTIQALSELKRETCDQALICSCVDQRAWLTQIKRGDDLIWAKQFTHGTNDPPITKLETQLKTKLTVITSTQDPHGMGAVQQAMTNASKGTPTAVWSITPDKRGLLLAFARIAQ